MKCLTTKWLRRAGVTALLAFVAYDHDLSWLALLILVLGGFWSDAAVLTVPIEPPAPDTEQAVIDYGKRLGVHIRREDIVDR